MNRGNMEYYVHEFLQNSGKTLGYSWDMIRKFWWFIQKNDGQEFGGWIILPKGSFFLPLCQLFVFGNGWTTNINHWGNIENNTQLRCQLVVEVSLLAPNATGTFEGSCFLPSFNFSHLLLGGSFNLYLKNTPSRGEHKQIFETTTQVIRSFEPTGVFNLPMDLVSVQWSDDRLLYHGNRRGPSTPLNATTSRDIRPY